MHKTTRSFSTKTAVLIVSIAGVAFFGYSLYCQKHNWVDLQREFYRQFSWDNVHFLLITLVLMPINWILEGQRWKHVLTPIYNLSRRTAFRGVLMGVAVSIFTPNRIGEFLGRMVNIPAHLRWKAVTGQVIGSVFQLAILTLCGGASTLYLLANFDISLPIALQHIVLFILFLLLFIVLLARSLTLLTLAQRFLKVHWFATIRSHIEFIRNYRPETIVSIVVLTIVRIATYVLQYVLLLRFFGVHSDFIPATSAILATYWIQSILPLPILLGLVARGEITLVVWQIFSVNELAVLSASYLLWVINVFVPALVGLRLLMKADVAKSFNVKI